MKQLGALSWESRRRSIAMKYPITKTGINAQLEPMLDASADLKATLLELGEQLQSLKDNVGDRNYLFCKMEGSPSYPKAEAARALYNMHRRDPNSVSLADVLELGFYLRAPVHEA
jgi:hypothetical protein